MADEEVPTSFGELAEMIEKTVHRAREIRAHHELKPSKGSAVYRLLNARPDNPQYRESAQTAYAAAFASLPGSENLLEGIGTLLTTNNPFAVTLLARGVIEWSARLAWVFDRDLTVDDLLSRWWTEYLSSLWEQRNVLPVDEGKRREDLSQRLEEEVEEARSFALQVFESRRWSGRFYVGEPRKSSADQIDLLYQPIAEGFGRQFWKYFSGFAHGTTYALMQLYGAEPSPDMSSSEYEFAIQSDKPEHIERPIALALLGFLQAYAKVIRCHSWESTYWFDWAQRCDPRLKQLLFGE